jgi:two-component system chemotaxis sensor kinase CheA
MVLLDGQLLRVGEQTFVLPLVAIVESILPAPGAVHVLAGGAEVLRVRDAVVPLLRLRRLLGGTDAPGAEDESLAVIVEHPDGRRALLVDELLSQQQVVIKSLDTSMGRLPGLAGATILGDGRVALILDVHGLITSGRAV